MPATEQTRYNLKILHKSFAVAGVVLFLSTILMFALDHYREWKPIQRTSNRIEIQMAKWRELQQQTDDMQQKRQRLTAALSAVRSSALPSAILKQFLAEVHDDAVRREQDEPTFADVEALNSRLTNEAADAATVRNEWQKLQAKAAKARADAEDAAEEAQDADDEEAKSLRQTASEAKITAEEAAAAAETAGATKDRVEARVAKVKKSLLGALQQYIATARFREDEALRERKFEMANLDAAKAALGIDIREGKPERALKKLQAGVDVLKESVRRKTLAYEQAAGHRKKLQSIFDQLTADELAISKQLDDLEAESRRLEKLVVDKRSRYFDFYGIIPLPGKKWLELPILDAFNSPRKIENLWSDNLDQQFGSFKRVRRFDRCTTCHQEIDKTLPGTSDQPSFVEATTLQLRLALPEEQPEGLAGEDAERKDRDQDLLDAQLQQVFGIRLARDGLLHANEVTVKFVTPASLGSQARVRSDNPEPVRGGDLRDQLFELGGPEVGAPPGTPGLMVGDVIFAIDGEPVPQNGDRRAWVAKRLVDAAVVNWAAIEEGEDPKQPVRLTIRRGLPNPYASHPRLDLFVGSMSPHKLADFACTVCHEGQGSATAFKWASHSPNDPDTEQRWKDAYGWFDNHHWSYPMLPRRFAESGCLKCHHDVLELQPSVRFPEGPAPQVVQGYNTIRKYGCFGCHEINGYDGPNRRVGPDLRLEPNYYAAALQFKGAPDTGYESLTDEEKSWVERVITTPEDDQNRRRVYTLLLEDAAKAAPRQMDAVLASGDGQDEEEEEEPEEPRFSDYVHKNLLPLLKDQETPGTERKVAPSLRFVGKKLDPTFLYDWIRRPANFRPSTRMPQFFGLWDHLPGPVLRRKRDALQRELAGLQEAGEAEQKQAAAKIEQLQAEIAQVEADLEGLSEVEQRFEPIELLGIVTYLQNRSQAYEYQAPPSGITPVTTEEEKQAQIARGKVAFQERGCLACHAHKDFPNVEKYRDPDYLAQGPDLSRLADKFAADRNANGPQWLYSWIQEPSRYNVRTLMPNLLLEPVEHRDESGAVTSVTDPAADIVAYLLSGARNQWQPAAGAVGELDEQSKQALHDLAMLHLRDTFPESLAQRYIEHGIPAEQREELKGAERELVVTADEEGDISDEQMVPKLLLYVARKAIVTHGCFACHDLPGFEDAKPIGTGLADWGRKDPTKLAFLNILQYVGIGGGAHGGAAPATASHGLDSPVPSLKHLPPYYHEQLTAGSRIGFIFQKLTEPRSYDYRDTENKRYSERLRMPQFPLSEQQREAVITFVLGLVADPPATKYVFRPNPRQNALLQGGRVLAKFNCQGCHLLEPEKWRLAYPEDYYGEQAQETTYPFIAAHFTREQQEAARALDRRGLRSSFVEGMPSISNTDAKPQILDEDEFPIEEEEDEEYEPDLLVYAFDLFKPTLIDGEPYQTGQAVLPIPAEHIEKRYRSSGGTLTKYLMPLVFARTVAADPTNAEGKGAQVWAWLPPPLMGEGNKVRPDWLHDFLLDPYPLRPAVVLRMPRFNMSTQDATALVDYFAAWDRAKYPYEFNEKRRDAQLAQADAAYAARLRSLAAGGELKLTGNAQGRYLIDAMRVVTNGNYCVKCHLVGDFDPVAAQSTKAPDLSRVYQRLRTDYVRKWIARPTSVHPYTAMPVNIPYNPDAPFLGSTVPQDLFHGTSEQQLEALVDLLMNYDTYSKQRSLIAPLVQQQQATAPATDETAASAGTE